MVLNQHHCKGELKSVAFFVEAESCHSPSEAAMPADCPFHPQPEADHDPDNGCCDDETQLIKVPSVQEAISHLWQAPVTWTLSPEPGPLFLWASSYHRAALFLTTYQPPPLVCNMPVRLQTFRC